MTPDYYDADYFLRGRETGKSLYTDYRWIPELTIPMAEAIVAHLGAKKPASFLDWGCARGFLVKALRTLGYDAVGYDPSQWAVDNCHPDVKGVVSTTRDKYRYDWAIAKDVLEHVHQDHLHDAIADLVDSTRRGVFIVVPLSPAFGHPYVVPEYEQDKTHQIRMSLTGWLQHIRDVTGDKKNIDYAYRVPGVKDNYHEKYPTGNGFFTITEKV